jgi:RNA polymerase sigma-70 factor (ECF subfamily)
MDRDPNQTVRNTAEQAFSRLIAELKAGRNEALANYLAAMGRFRGYSWQNVLLITAQRPDATHVAGIHTWNDLGRMVKTGDKSILIFAPEEGHGSTAWPEDDHFRMPGFRAASVFDLAQTEGRPLPESVCAPLEVDEFRNQLKTLVARQAIDLKYDRGIAQAVEYVVSRGLRTDANSAPADYYALHRGDKKALAQSLAFIQQSSAQILNELFPEGRTAAGRILTAPTPQAPPQLDAEEFGKLHTRYRNRVVQSVAGFVRDQEKAEDIAAHAFQLAWEKRTLFRGDASPHTWIQAIARNAALESRRRDHRVQFEPVDRSDAHEFPAPELVTDELEKQDDRFRLQQALARLPAQHRRVLGAHFVDGFSVREIARRERVPLGTVLSRIHKGKQLLREAWEAYTLPQPVVRADGPLPPKPAKSQESHSLGASGEPHPRSPEPGTLDR